MARPSGTCNGQSCYTPADKAEIAAEKVVRVAERDVLQAALTAKDGQITALDTELALANGSMSCPM